ncbi:hypothetical protein CJ030_MR5G024780 [Morella rubra]|uniref:Uncharacterized protein n=1 Tax=Morella rubra TaxID=262757 RepID=A0A6A1VKC3_9ROSI|nr:hypothetical protein CJ030_MR5G024780 [Morella rubra]
MQQDPQSQEDYMTWEEQQWAEILSRSVIVEREVAVADFKEMKYMVRKIGDIMDDLDWIRHLKREDVAYVDLVREFYAILLDVADLDAPVWTVTVCGVTIQLPVEILAAFMGDAKAN